MSLKDSEKWEHITTVDYFKTHHLVTGLQPEKDYIFAVSAENDVGVGDRQKTLKPIRLERPVCKFMCCDVVK